MYRAPLVCFALTTFMLSGCGGGGGGGSSQATLNLFDGSGTEVQGFLVYDITASSGLYTDAWYGPVGLTGRLEVSSDAPGTVSLDRQGQASIIMEADSATRSYRGSCSYIAAAGGVHAGKEIDEVWTLAFSGSTPVLTVQAGVDDDSNNGTPPSATGSMSLRLEEPWTHVESVGDPVYYGRTTAFSTDSRYLDQTGYLEIGELGGGPGSCANLHLSHGQASRDVIYIECLRKVGSTLVGAGYYDGDLGGRMSAFGAVVITLDEAGRPVSSTATIWDTATGDALHVAHQAYRSESTLEATYDSSYTHYDLTVDTITAGGQLEDAFGTSGSVMADAFSSDGANYYFMPIGYLAGGYADGSDRVFVLWGGRAYALGTLPSYEFDGLLATRERLTVRMHIDGDGTATGGTAHLELYDAAGAPTGTEDATFSLSLSAP